MKKIIAILLALVMLLAFAACAPAEEEQTTTTTTGNSNVGGNENNDDPNAGNEDPVTPDGPAVVNIADHLANADAWESDGDVYITADGIEFDNFWAGDFAAARLVEPQQDVTYKMNIQILEIPEGLNMEPDWTWWDAEISIELRSSVCGSTSTDGQTGYCLTAWGDMKEVYVGRSGHDDAFGTFQWDLYDGQPHDVEFSAINNEDGTVTLVVVVDGVEVFRAIDDGTAKKNENVTPMYLDAGGLTLRCKYLHVIVK